MRCKHWVKGKHIHFVLMYKTWKFRKFSKLHTKICSNCRPARVAELPEDLKLAAVCLRAVSSLYRKITANHCSHLRIMQEGVQMALLHFYEKFDVCIIYVMSKVSVQKCWTLDKDFDEDTISPWKKLEDSQFVFKLAITLFGKRRIMWLTLDFIVPCTPSLKRLYASEFSHQQVCGARKHSLHSQFLFIYLSVPESVQESFDFCMAVA